MYPNKSFTIGVFNTQLYSNNIDTTNSTFANRFKWGKYN